MSLKTDDVCGTVQGASRHKRRSEETCRSCKDAYNVYQKRRRAKRARANKGEYKYPREIAWDYAKAELGRRHRKEQVVLIHEIMESEKVGRDSARSRANVRLARDYGDEMFILVEEYLAGQTGSWLLVPRGKEKPRCHCKHPASYHQTRSTACRLVSCKCKGYAP